MSRLRSFLALGALALLLSPAAAHAQFYSPYRSPYYATPYYSSYYVPPLAGTPYAHLHGYPWGYGYYAPLYGTVTAGTDLLPFDARWRENRSIYTPDVFDRQPRMRTSLYPALPFRELREEVSANAARIEVQVPDPSAQVWFNGALTSQTGTRRSFVTPPLTPGTEYAYEVRTQWRDATGQEQTSSRQVTVRAGQTSAVSFGGGL